jgi:Uma2 family endonuclease
MVMVAPFYYTADMVRALPDDGNRYETVHGELLVTPAPRAWHQELVSRLLVDLVLYLRSYRVGHLIASPADISWGSDTLVQPDLFVVPVEQARTLEWTAMRSLLLAIEVLSPSSARADRFTKRRLYLQQGVPAYWVIDGDQHIVEVWTPESEWPSVQRERVEWRPVDAAAPFELDLRHLFQPI